MVLAASISHTQYIPQDPITLITTSQTLITLSITCLEGTVVVVVCVCVSLTDFEKTASF